MELFDVDASHSMALNFTTGEEKRDSDEEEKKRLTWRRHQGRKSEGPNSHPSRGKLFGPSRVNNVGRGGLKPDSALSIHHYTAIIECL
jgi:hypothetical protein